MGSGTPSRRLTHALRVAFLFLAVTSLLTLAVPNALAADGPHFPSSFWVRHLSPGAPLDPQSEQMARELRNQAAGVSVDMRYDCWLYVYKLFHAQWSITPEEKSNCRQVAGRATLATDAYAPNVYTVPGDQPRVPVVLDSWRSDGLPPVATNWTSLRSILAAGVPIPPDASQTLGTDGQLIIWQPATDTMWEFWRAYRDSSSTWHVRWGGRMLGVSKSPGYWRDVLAAGSTLRTPVWDEHHTWGGPSSRMPALPGVITLDDMARGRIDHAIVMAIQWNRAHTWSYPAQGTDGRGGSIIPQGAHFRLDPAYDVSTIKNPAARIIATAMQEYGVYVNNSTSGITLYAEGWRPHLAASPWTGPSGWLRGLIPVAAISEIPWDRMQALPTSSCPDSRGGCPEPLSFGDTLLPAEG